MIYKKNKKIIIYQLYSIYKKRKRTLEYISSIPFIRSENHILILDVIYWCSFDFILNTV